MPSVKYGTKTIEYELLEKDNLQAHYITVQKGEGVILKGKKISKAQADRLILKKAKWIIDKLDLVASIKEDDIVTGSRVQYLGRKYYVEIFIQKEGTAISIDFTASKFKVHVPEALNNQQEIKYAFSKFLGRKAVEKIGPRVRKWSKETGLSYKELKFRKLEKRWGSCTPSNNIILNVDAIQLPFSLIDYLIVHELVHTKIKNHSKAFWAAVSTHLPNWKALDAEMYGMKL